ncbi:MAG: aminotransferase class I/II-fold pyridoxal phosphate-dependent enzyme [Bacteroidetes bacterium]|nr:aminotransferase class I/II-fold pyridoxal phosphate-dependent enzyme [Bacteroidota bacterium]MCW5895876.1 aminotransferase class I/II-fold pyridoxal phosphate-dependent enzyme [Bacteroidota bacterium]
MKKKTSPSAISLATRAIHGSKLYAYKGPVSTPIYQTSTYRFESSDNAVRYAQGDPNVMVYTRYHNPTTAEVEERLALMMNAEKALLLASGMAAITSAVLSVVKTGDEIISTPALYGGTYRFFRDILPRHGVEVKYMNPERPESLIDLASPRTRLIYCETPTNPTLNVVDIKTLVAATQRAERKFVRKIVTMVDNTFASCVNQNPFAVGVDVIVESGTKYLGGHSDLLAGVVAGSKEFVKGVHTQLKYYGGSADPFMSYLLYRSLKTFELRVERQNENAMGLARFLEKHPNVNRVLYPGLSSHPQHKIAKRQMVDAGGKGYGGMVTIEVKGGVKKAVRVCDSLRVAVNAMSLGGVETLVSIPVYSSHINMTNDELRHHGVTPGMIRISVGVEGLEDLKSDFAQALR